MTNYAFDSSIPKSNHNPSADQPLMLTNNISTKNLIAEDHYTFGVANGGFHKQMRIPALATTANLSPRIANSGTVWTQVNTSVGVSTETNLHYIPGTGANDYQLTRVISSAFPLFSKSTQNYNLAGNNLFGGWTFLPGGLLLQYGYNTTIGRPNPASNQVVFPVAFSSTPFSIVITPQRTSSTNVDSVYILDGSLTSTGFTIVATSTSFTAVYWQVIGK